MNIGVMNDPSKPVDKEILAIASAGYDFIDLTVEGPRALDIDIKKVLSILKRHNLFVVGHTDPCLPYAYPLEAVRRACFNELLRCARIFQALGAKIMNIHPCYACPPAMKSSLVQLNVAALKPIVKMVADHGLTVVLENFRAPFDRVSTFKDMLAAVSGLELHLDFGHANMGPDGPEIFCRHLGPAVKHVHFSDNRTSGDHHMPLGAGNIDWSQAVSALKTTGYDGTITLEVFCRESRVLFQYLEISRKLLLDLWEGAGDRRPQYSGV